MSALQGLERAFQAHVHRGEGAMEQRVVATEAAGARDRLAIYVDAYRLRLLDVLRDDFPGLMALSGDEEFERLGRSYIDAHPSTYFNARWYGEGLPDFLRSTLPWSEQPALAEMALLEWGMTLAFDAVDEPIATAGAASGIAPERWGAMVPVVHSAVRLLRLSWNVCEIRKAVDRKTPAVAPGRLPAPQAWIVWRKDLAVYYRPLDAEIGRASCRERV